MASSSVSLFSPKESIQAKTWLICPTATWFLTSSFWRGLTSSPGSSWPTARHIWNCSGCWLVLPRFLPASSLITKCSISCNTTRQSHLTTSGSSSLSVQSLSDPGLNLSRGGVSGRLCQISIWSWSASSPDYRWRVRFATHMLQYGNPSQNRRYPPRRRNPSHSGRRFDRIPTNSLFKLFGAFFPRSCDAGVLVSLLQAIWNQTRASFPTRRWLGGVSVLWSAIVRIQDEANTHQTCEAPGYFHET